MTSTDIPQERVNELVAEVRARVDAYKPGDYLPVRKPKYNNRPASVDGRVFDSRAEKPTMTFQQFQNQIEHSKPTYSRYKYLVLPLAEREKIYAVAIEFINKCSKMGPSSALELLCNLGTWHNEKVKL